MECPLRFVYMDIGDGNKYTQVSGKWYVITDYKELPDFFRYGSGGSELTEMDLADQG